MGRKHACWDESQQLLEAMRRAGVPAFQPDAFGLAERDLVLRLIELAREHHKIAERLCSDDMGEVAQSRVQQRESQIEVIMLGIASRLGLAIHFDGDPRGFTVKLHAPKNDVFNTWGGAETGYGIGEAS